DPTYAERRQRPSAAPARPSAGQLGRQQHRPRQDAQLSPAIPVAQQLRAARQLARRRRLVERQHHVLTATGFGLGKHGHSLVEGPLDGGLDEQLDRAPYLRRISAGLFARLIEIGAGFGPRGHVAMAGYIPLVGMARDDPQHLGLLSTDDDRWMRSLNRL